MLFRTLVFVSLLLAPAAAAQDTGALPPGLDGSYRLLAAWREAAPSAPGLYVEGYRVEPQAGGPSLDFYYLEGAPLGEAAIAALGIAPKEWAAAPRQTPARPVHVAKRIAVPAPRTAAAGLLPGAGVTLPMPDLAALAAEDEVAKGPYRIGVVQALPDPIRIDQGVPSLGTWSLLPDGTAVWAVQIDAPGALGQRLELTQLDVPEGGRVIVYNAADPSENYGPFTGIPPGDPSLWTPTCYGESVIIECSVPSAAQEAGLTLVLEQATYGYREMPVYEKQAGSCNLDLSCYPAWADTALGIAGVGSISQQAAISCSCALIASNDECSDAYYILTANHCINSQKTISTAGSAEFYWFYQTDACDGTAPSPASVPRTYGGATFLAGMGGAGISTYSTILGNDFTLLRLRNAPPDGAVALGWSTDVMPIGTDVVTIHHPRGDYKRITFGALSDQDNERAEYFHEVTWSAGTTQGGSSGGPLLRADTHQIIGQLWGGLAACDNEFTPDVDESKLPDYYGRFDVTYPIVQLYLDPPLMKTGFASDVYIVEEGAGEINLLVTLNTPARGPGLTVTYSVIANGAVAGEDYTVGDGTLSFDARESAKVLPVTILDDTITESSESLLFVLSDPTCGEIDAAASSTTLFINDDDTPHSADTDGDWKISEAELLRVIELYSAGGYHCSTLTADGFMPGAGNQTCAPHASDYAPADWSISLSEVLRAVQLHNAGAYHRCAQGEDGYCLGL